MQIITKKKFKCFEQACKRMWSALAENGKPHKPNEAFTRWLHGCPACEIAERAARVNNNNGDYSRCYYCPIDDWRVDSKKIINRCPCERTKSPYYVWSFSLPNSKDKRKEAAKKISEMKWSWLDTYKKRKDEI